MASHLTACNVCLSGWCFGGTQPGRRGDPCGRWPSCACPTGSRRPIHRSPTCRHLSRIGGDILGVAAVRDPSLVTRRVPWYGASVSPRMPGPRMNITVCLFPQAGPLPYHLHSLLVIPLRLRALPRGVSCRSGSCVRQCTRSAAMPRTGQTSSAVCRAFCLPPLLCISSTCAVRPKV